jgi:putative peptidoglycan lipid II flippase
MQVPETLIGTAIGTALLPTLSEQITRGEGEAFRQALDHSMRVILAFTLPSAVLLAVAIRPVVAILGFDAAGSDLVVWTTRAYLVGLIGHSLLEVAARAFYAQQDARTPLFASALTIVSFIVFGTLLSPVLGAPGIGLANSLAFSGEALLLWWLLVRRFTGLVQLRNLLPRVVSVSAGSGLLVFALMRLPLPQLPLAIGALAVAGLITLPFLWTEVKLLVKL